MHPMMDNSIGKKSAGATWELCYIRGLKGLGLERAKPKLQPGKLRVSLITWLPPPTSNSFLDRVFLKGGI